MSSTPRTETLARRSLALAMATALVGVLAAARTADATGQAPSHWTTSRAAQIVGEQPPRSWVRRGWSVVMVNCDGLAARRSSGDSSRYGAFSCEFTLVAPMRSCRSSGDYVCVAGYDAFVLARTLRVVGPTRYALSRVP